MATRKRTPAAIRFNNSGAQYPGPISRRFGSPGHSVIGGGHLIARFDTPEQGAAAHFALLGSRYSGLTLEGAIKKWSGGNSSSAYLRHVSRASGLQPSDRLTRDVLAGPQGLAMVRSMAHWEAGGQRYPLDDEGWARAQQAGLGSGEAYERLRQQQAAGARQRVATAGRSQQGPDTSDPSFMAGADITPNVGPAAESEATRRMMASGKPVDAVSALPGQVPMGRPGRDNERHLRAEMDRRGIPVDPEHRRIAPDATLPRGEARRGIFGERRTGNKLTPTGEPLGRFLINEMFAGNQPITPTTPASSPETSADAGSMGKAGTMGSPWPAWASEAFERAGNMPVEPISAVSSVPEAPPSSRLLLGDNGLSPMWSHNAPPMRGLLSAMFGGFGGGGW